MASAIRRRYHRSQSRDRAAVRLQLRTRMSTWLQLIPLPPLALWLGALVLGLALLVKAADWFTSAADLLGRSFGLSPFVVGVTIMAVGTSLPELVSSVLAVIRGASEIVAGNVVGSNITNIFLIMGLIGVVAGRLRMRHELINVDLPFLAGSAFLLAAILWDGGVGLGEGLLSLAGLALYLHYALRNQRIPEGQRDDRDADGNRVGRLVPSLVVLASAALIWLGAEMTVSAVIELSDLLGIGREVIAASAVALGTSLPEVMVSLAATRQGKGELAIGNVLGSNVFNAFAVIGVSALFGTLLVPASILGFALPLMVIATLLAFFMVMEQELTLWEGWLLLLFYVYFLGALFEIM
ncbi:MAG TPA: calcium/sodium antiporter [Geminicoccaceae bacterium]